MRRLRRPKAPIKSILMTADTIGGVWTYSIELARALSASGITVYLATMGEAPDEAQRKEARAAGNIKLFESSFKLEWMEDPWEDVERSGEWLLLLETELCPDIIHLNGYCHGASGFKAPVLIAAHSCVLSWWAAVKGGTAPSYWERYREEAARGLWSADMIVAPTNAMLSAIYGNYFVRASCRVIHNGRRSGLFKQSGKENFIFTAGRLWDEAKNVRALSDIAPDLDWPVYAAGTDSAGKEACRTDGLTMLGRLTQEELALYLSKASIFALPAYYEPFGLSILEAGLSGSALVLGDIASLRELWDGSAIFVPPGDKAAIKKAIKSLTSDPREISRLGMLARERAATFTPERMAEGYMAAYTHIKETGGERRCVS